MTWELYEVWTEDKIGHQELVDTTKSKKEAQALAKKSLDDGFSIAIIYRELENGDIEEVERVAAD